LAALRALSTAGLEVAAFERGSRAGGNWVLDNDNGWSAAYGSLRTNVSRRRMQYPSFPMPRRFGQFVGHADMASYLQEYARAADLLRLTRFGVTVESAQPQAGGWVLRLDDGTVETCDALVCAAGWNRVPCWPEWALAGDHGVPITHSHDYRRPAPFRGRRVLVVGAGSSAMEIAVEVSTAARRTILSVRSGRFVIPRLVNRRPYDELDSSLINRMPWALLNRVFVGAGRLDRLQPPGLPRPPYRPLEQLPSICSGMTEAVRTGAVELRPGIERLQGGRAVFADGTQDEVDAVICGTGYRIEFPFLRPGLIPIDGHCVELYRRIVPPAVPNLFFVGLLEAPGGLLPIVEAQAEWIADTLTGRLPLPSCERMRAAAGPERRTRERFPLEPSDSIRCDRHAYLRRLRRDRRRVSRRLRSAEPPPQSNPIRGGRTEQ
jgi:cation diffusion facilitator CzcD-associated flavoprotein CzcO